MAEHNLEGPVLGIAMDGTGYGPDGSVWGGEFLLCKGNEYQRLAHIHEAPLPGGEKRFLSHGVKPYGISEIIMVMIFHLFTKIG